MAVTSRTVEVTGEPGGARSTPGRPAWLGAASRAPDRPHELVRLVTRLVIAQAAAAAAMGRRLQPPSPALDGDHAAAGGRAVGAGPGGAVGSPTQGWILAIAFETAFILVGPLRFFSFPLPRRHALGHRRPRRPCSIRRSRGPSPASPDAAGRGLSETGGRTTPMARSTAVPAS